MKHATPRPRRRATRRHGLLLGALAALAVSGLAWPLGASAAPLYPDLRVIGPYGLTMTQDFVNGEMHNVLTFETRALNAGEGPLEVDLTPTSTGIGDLTQRIYESPVGFTDRRIGALPFGIAPFDFPGFARYEIWSKRTFERAQSRNFTRGAPLYVNPEVSYCLADDAPANEDDPEVRRYFCTATVQGISVGWTRDQGTFTIGQWVDVGTSPIPDGQYVLRTILDPEKVLAESASNDPAREGDVANSGIAYFTVIGGRLAGTE